jgi:hypothetical protein
MYLSIAFCFQHGKTGLGGAEATKAAIYKITDFKANIKNYKI